MPKKTTNNQKSSNCFKKAGFLVLAVAILASINNGQFFNVLADKYDEQIKELKRQNQQYDDKAASLRKQANSLAEEIGLLDKERRAIQAQINKTNQKIAQLKKDILKLTKQIEVNKDALGDVIAEIYLADEVSQLERLASSKDITEYIDEEVVRSNIQVNLSKKLAEIKEQKVQLEKNKKEVERQLKAQTAQKNQLVAKEQQKQLLLNQTKGDEAAYKRLAAKNNSKIESLLEAQREANRRLQSQGSNVMAGDPNHGGYPAYLDYPQAQDSLVDPWGMYNRECVSYTAWKAQQKLGYKINWGFRGSAHAKYWTHWARVDGLTVKTGVPAPNTVAVTYGGPYGHVMWVERINPNGTIHISQYNLNGTGYYSEMDISPAGVDFIYFN